MNKQTQTQPTIAEYLKALAVLESANIETIKAVALVASPDNVDTLANALSFLACHVSVKLREKEEALKEQGQWVEAFKASMMAYSVDEYDSAIEQAHELSGFFVNSADEIDDLDASDYPTAETFDEIVDSYVSNSH